MTRPKPIADHKHHWLIDTPNGSHAAGRCKHCGAEREFRNCHPQDAPETTGLRDISLRGSYPKRVMRGRTAVHRSKDTPA